ncbi:hypothetical protein LCGC14_0736460 [marine sediment metagenome]|uniref:Uncharacterized protein n=1 Tax=marine sediment metagenome TaxID=412755 RepID=A0A0F9TFB6_9ZZZZ
MTEFLITESVVVITIGPSPDLCCVCEGESSGKHSIALYEDLFVADDDPEWAGFDACVRCFDLRGCEVFKAGMTVGEAREILGIVQ